MSGPIVTQMMPNPWPLQPKPSRFDQLLRAKLAAEQSTPAPSTSTPVTFDVATAANLQGSDTVMNRSFVGQYYQQPIAKATSPIPDQFPINAPQAEQSLQPSSMPLSPLPSPSPQQPLASPLEGTEQLGSEQLAASFRSMVTQRINNMYATAQAQAQAQAPVEPVRRPRLSVDMPIVHVTPTSPVHTPYSQAPSPYSMVPSPASLVPSPTIPQGPMTHSPTTPVYKYNYSDTRSEVKPEPEWSTGYQAPPFMWNVTPPQNGEIAVPSSTPSLHSASNSLDSRISHSPLTPQMVPFPQFPSADVKPVVSPALSTVTLPTEDQYPQYGPGVFAGMTPRFIGASADQDSSSLGNGLYDAGNDGYLNSAGDVNGLEGLGFGNGDGGGGGGDDHEHNGNGDQDPPELIVPAPRQKKLPLACHFCRRRKLKCDGIKPSCDNCNKRGIECTYDENVRRRGPGKRTKEMRERAVIDAAEAGLIHSVASAIGVGQSSQMMQHLQDESEHQTGHLEHDQSDLMLDPALADENGGPRHDDVMEAMGALKQAGIELGLHHEELDDLGGPNTLAELSGLGDQDHLEHLGHEHDDEESRKRKAEYDLEEESKRIKLSLTQGDDVEGLDLLDHV